MTRLLVCLLVAVVAPQVKKVQRFDFDEDVVEAGTLRPEGEAVEGRGSTGFDSLIRPRLSFYPELVRSAEKQ